VHFGRGASKLIQGGRDRHVVWQKDREAREAGSNLKGRKSRVIGVKTRQG